MTQAPWTIRIYLPVLDVIRTYQGSQFFFFPSDGNTNDGNRMHDTKCQVSDGLPPATIPSPTAIMVSTEPLWHYGAMNICELGGHSVQSAPWRNFQLATRRCHHHSIRTPLQHLQALEELVMFFAILNSRCVCNNVCTYGNKQESNSYT